MEEHFKSNNNIYDKFLYIIDVGIETSNINILQEAIINYKPLICDKYIKIAETIYQEMLIEKIDDLKI